MAELPAIATSAPVEMTLQELEILMRVLDMYDPKSVQDHRLCRSLFEALEAALPSEVTDWEDFKATPGFIGAQRKTLTKVELSRTNLTTTHKVIKDSLNQLAVDRVTGSTIGAFKAYAGRYLLNVDDQVCALLGLDPEKEAEGKK